MLLVRMPNAFKVPKQALDLGETSVLTQCHQQKIKEGCVVLVPWCEHLSQRFVLLRPVENLVVSKIVQDLTTAAREKRKNGLLHDQDLRTVTTTGVDQVAGLAAARRRVFGYVKPSVPRRIWRPGKLDGDCLARLDVFAGLHLSS
jgi:hypothetical protein